MIVSVGQYRATAGFTKDFADLMVALSDRLAGVIGRYTVGETVPPRYSAALREECGDLVDQTFTGGRRDVFDPTTHTANSPFGGILNKWLVYSVWTSVNNQTEYIQRHTSADLQVWLRNAAPKAMPQYDAPHTWVDPNGYRLSDRVWGVSMRTRMKIDKFLADSINRGVGSLAMSRQLEQFLVPGRAPIRTSKPYGTDASYDAMRLARTENTRAWGQTTITAAQNNPWVDGVDWALSLRHPDMDICDELATLGKGGGRLKEPYGKNDVPLYPAHPHELCNLQPHVSASPADVARKLRADLEAGKPAPFTPLARDPFVEMLIGAALLRLYYMLFGSEE